MKMAIQHIALDHSDELYCVIGFGSFFQNKLIFDDIDILFGWCIKKYAKKKQVEF